MSGVHGVDSTMRIALPCLFALCLHAQTAHAEELDEKIEIWSVTEVGLAGEDGHDEAHGIAIDDDGNYVVVDWLDGDVDHQDDAYLIQYDNAGAMVWDHTLDGGVIDNVDQFSSNDRYYDIALDGDDNICLAGATSPTGTDYDRAYLVQSYDIAGTWLWEDLFQDDVASLEQDAFGIAVDSADAVYTTGWSYRAGNIAGQWTSFKHLPITGNRDIGPVYWNFGAEDFAPDQSMDVAVATDGFVVVGAVGVDGGSDADDADLDFHVRKYGPDGTLLWDYTYPGGGLADVATGVAVLNTDEVIVVGYTNEGTDNAANADYDWVMVKLEADGYNAAGVPVWETTWKSDYYRSERAYDVAIDVDGELVVVGDWDDGGTRAWRAMRASEYDGSQLSEWNWAAGAGHSAPMAVTTDREVVAIAGYVHNGVDRDFYTVALDIDSDEDGTGDSVDECPDDELKIEEGLCGCGDSDEDTDGDGLEDCNDLCPDDPEKTDDAGVCGCNEVEDDRDGDGTEDCIDNCPDDPEKTALGECGCGLPDDDSDGDGILGCDDACSNTPEGTVVDDHGCPESTETDTDTTVDDGSDDGKGGCACSSSPAPTGGFVFLLAVVALLRRR